MSLLLRHRFKLLLATLAMAILVGPVLLDSVAETAPDLGRHVVFVLTLCMLLAGTVVVRGEHGSMVFTLILVAASVVVEAIAAYAWPRELALYNHGLRILFLAYIIVEVLKRLFHPETVTYDTLCASLCVYLLIGLLWMNLYVIVETHMPGSIALTDPAGQAAPSGEVERTVRMLYFSFTTLTSVGYGDIVPRTNLARMLAITEALVGQCYLLVMVSRMVGLHVAQAFPGGSVNPPAATQQDINQ
jgi:voltage-gated potassium channel